MIKIVLCDSSKEYINWMKIELENIIKKQGYSAEFSLITNRPEKVLQHIERETGLVLYILDAIYPQCDINGIDLARHIREKDRDSYIVFNSSSEEYLSSALKGLIRPSGFFLKPMIRGDIETLLGDIYHDYLDLKEINLDVLNINIGQEIYRLEYDTIIYIEAFQKKIYIHTTNQRIGYYDSLSSLESRLGGGFIRCHRSYIINKNKISRLYFPQMKIQMQNGAKIDISRTYKNLVKDKLGIV